MLFEVFLHTLQEHRQTMLVWGLSILLYGILTALLYPLLAIHPVPGFIAWFGRLVGINDALQSAEVWLNLVGFALIFPLVMSFLAVWVASRLIAVDEHSGALDLLLSYPLPRWRLVIEKFAALALIVILITAALWLVLMLVNTALALNITGERLAGACLGLALLALVYGSVAFCITSYTGRARYARWITWIAVGITYLLAAVWLHHIPGLRLFSPFYYAAALPPHAEGLPWLHVLLLLAVAGASIDAARRGFEQRDLAV